MIVSTQGRVQDWLTTNELWKQYEIPSYTVYRWGKKLLDEGFARKLKGGRGAWLISPDAIPFLKGRKGKVGRPKENDDGT